MIAFLSGIIKLKTANYVILSTHDVGYKVYVPTNIIASIRLNQPFSLFIHTYVKENTLDLYGFLTQEDLNMFELLLEVSGIGPKIAISIFSNGKLEKIKEAIIKGDVDFFASVPRLGRKNAQKIIIELRSKLGSLGDLDLTEEGNEAKEIIDALKSFGFSNSEARDAYKSIKDFDGDTSAKIKQALKYLGKK